MTTGDLYHRLGIPRSASLEDVKAAYRNAARRFHPDSNSNTGAVEEFKLIAEAYSILGDPTRRTTYDSSTSASGGALLSANIAISRETLPQLKEPQVWYVLVDVTPKMETGVPDPAVNLCIVVDRSTSMQGARLDQVKASVINVIDSLRDNDSFSVVAFSDKAEVIISAQQSLTERAIAKAKVSAINPSGGTEILQGLLCGLMELHQNLSPNSINHLLLLTDGRTYGDEDDCLMLASLAATDGIAISGLGIGDEWNDRFLDDLTGRTGGIAAYVSTPQQLKTFIQDRVRALGNTFAGRLCLQVTLDPDMLLDSAFKFSPEAGPVPVTEQPLRLGNLPKRQTISILLKFRIPPLAPGHYAVARLSFFADVVGLNRQGERAISDLVVTVAEDPPPAVPPTAVMEALRRLSQYKLQERAWQEADTGDVTSASQRLQTLSTRLLASGQTDLAKVALAEARRLESTHILSEEAKKQLKYGTRALLAPPTTGRKP